jgi:hypothetical protein
MKLWLDDQVNDASAPGRAARVDGRRRRGRGIAPPRDGVAAPPGRLTRRPPRRTLP